MKPAPSITALAAALAGLLLAGCTGSTAGDCIDGLEGQRRCFSDAATPSGTEICLDGEWQLFAACDVPGGEACTTCVALDGGGVPHACTPCPAPNSEARCALSAALTCG